MAPYLFTKLFRPLVQSWRAAGLLCALYLDDGIFVADTLSAAVSAASRIRSDLAEAGVIISVDKCVWEPRSCLDWLGITVDLHAFQLSISQKRVRSTLEMAELLLSSPAATVRQRLQLTGKLISMAAVLGPIVQLKTRRLYQQINSVFPRVI